MYQKMLNVGSGGSGGASSADKVSYDNAQSGLSADNVQNAIDEVNDNFSYKSGDVVELPNLPDLWIMSWGGGTGAGKFSHSFPKSVKGLNVSFELKNGQGMAYKIRESNPFVEWVEVTNVSVSSIDISDDGYTVTVNTLSPVVNNGAFFYCNPIIFRFS